jgi:hypothetical protein
MREDRSPTFQRFVALCVPFLFALAVDGVATQAGQSAEYWSGDFTRANEMVTTLNDLLRIHPVAHAAGFLAHAAMICLLILLLPRLLAMVASLSATIGHATGAFTWLAYHFRFSFAVCQLFICCVALVISICLTRRWSFENDHPMLADKPLARWTLITLLVSIPVCLFFLR